MSSKSHQPVRKTTYTTDHVMELERSTSIESSEMSKAHLSQLSIEDVTGEILSTFSQVDQVDAVFSQLSHSENSLIVQYGEFEMNQVFGSQSMLSQEIEAFRCEQIGHGSKFPYIKSPSPKKRKVDTVSTTDNRNLIMDNISVTQDTKQSQNAFTGYEVLLDAARLLGKIEGSEGDSKSVSHVSLDNQFIVETRSIIPSLHLKEKAQETEGATVVPNTIPLPTRGHNTRTGRTLPSHRTLQTSALLSNDLQQNISIPSKCYRQTKNVTKQSILQARLVGKKNLVRKIPQKLEIAQRSDIENIAKKASGIVKLIEETPKVRKQLLLSMTLTRENPRSMPEAYPPRETIIGKGFQWNTYPPLVQVMRNHMEEYYEYSIERCQSSTQQEFNNRLVKKIMETSKSYGWTFDENELPLKEIRDRVRNWYKSNISNATRRLKTMMKNPTRPMNARGLLAHWDMIVLHNETRKQLVMADEFLQDRGSTILNESGLKADDTDKDAAALLAKGFKRKVYTR